MRAAMLSTLLFLDGAPLRQQAAVCLLVLCFYVPPSWMRWLRRRKLKGAESHRGDSVCQVLHLFICGEYSNCLCWNTDLGYLNGELVTKNSAQWIVTGDLLPKNVVFIHPDLGEFSATKSGTLKSQHYYLLRKRVECIQDVHKCGKCAHHTMGNMCFGLDSNGQLQSVPHPVWQSRAAHLFWNMRTLEGP